MTYGIRIKGLKEVQSMLGQDFAPTIRTATKIIALEVQGKVAPYPPATIANSPSNPKGRWYERSYGQRWWVGGARATTAIKNWATRSARSQRSAVLRLARKGTVLKGNPSSEMLNRKWSVEPYGQLGWKIINPATYAKFLHSAAKQARWAGARGWKTDEDAVEEMVRSGRVRQIIIKEVMDAFKKRRR